MIRKEESERRSRDVCICVHKLRERHCIYSVPFLASEIRYLIIKPRPLIGYTALYAYIRLSAYRLFYFLKLSNAMQTTMLVESFPDEMDFRSSK